MSQAQQSNGEACSDRRGPVSQEKPLLQGSFENNIERNTSRSPSPISPTTSFSGGSFSSTTTTTEGNHSNRSFEPSIFTGNTANGVNFKVWSAMMLAKLAEMTEAKVEEKVKMEYVVSHTGREAFQKLLDRFEEMKGKGVAFGSAKPMVLFLAQYYDEQIKMIDLRFGSQ